MYSIGYMTVVLYLISVTFFMVGAYYPTIMPICAVAGALFLIAATVIVGIMTIKRINT